MGQNETVEQKIHSRHEFSPEVVEALRSPIPPSSAQWRCAAATIIASQTHRDPGVQTLIRDAEILSRWLEHGSLDVIGSSD